MSQNSVPGATSILSEIAIRNNPEAIVVDTCRVRGGSRYVATLAERDAIPADARIMRIQRVYVQETDTTYELQNGIENADWVTIPTVTPGDYVDRTTNQVINGRKDFTGWVTFGDGDDGTGYASRTFWARGPGDYSSSIGIDGNFDFFVYNQSENFSGTKSVNLRLGSLAGDILFDNTQGAVRMRMKQTGNLIVGSANVDNGDRLQVDGSINTNRHLILSASGGWGPAINSTSTNDPLEIFAGNFRSAYFNPDGTTHFEQRMWIGIDKLGLSNVMLAVSGGDILGDGRLILGEQADTGERLFVDGNAKITGDLIVAGSVTGPLADYTNQANNSASNAAESEANAAGNLATMQSVISAYAWYGVEWNITVAATAMTRIGSTELHKSLPIHRRMRGCLLQDNGVVNYYLNPNDWTKKDNGTASVLDGTDGQVMVEIPAHYRRFETEGNIRRAKISEYPIPGYHLVPKYFLSAYEASVQRSVSKLASVVNSSTDYRGGNNTSAWDAESRTLLGRPVTNLTRTQFRTFARNRAAGSAWNCDVYAVQKALFWLYYVEYAELNCQAAFNSELNAQGFKQGGLGNGVTTLNSTLWNTWSSYNPFVRCGITNSIGNATGIVLFVLPPEYGASLTVDVPRYRGIENPFGHLWSWQDGVNIKIQANSAGNESQLWVGNNPATYNDVNYTDYTLRGLISRIDGYAKELSFGEFGEHLPRVAGGAGSGSTTYFSDYFYTSIPVSGESLRGLLSSGAASNGGTAGFGYAYTNTAPSSADTAIGSRLCYLGA